MNDSPRTNVERTREHDGDTVRVVTGARLHLGLLDTVAPFGGSGLMIDQPATEITVAPGASFQADEPIAVRARQIAERLCEFVGRDKLPPCRIEIIRRPLSHCGLGTGTQSSLAIAEGLCRFLQIKLDPNTLAIQIAGRGKRSAIGVHGYFHGGFIFEQSDSAVDLNPMQQRLELPETWRVVVVKPSQPTATISGDSEVEQFASLAPADPKAKSLLTNLLLEQILPAAQSGDFDRFASAVGQYNRASGMLFASVQGGPYHSEPVTELIEQMIQLGGQGVGQSSWGPGAFAWFESQAQSCQFISNLPADAEIISHTQPRNLGRVVTP